jgi:hypothetical protein
MKNQIYQRHSHEMPPQIGATHSELCALGYRKTEMVPFGEEIDRKSKFFLWRLIHSGKKGPCLAVNNSAA